MHISISKVFEVTDANGKVWRFEWHDYCGVDVISRRTDEVYQRQPSKKSPFWPAFDRWLKDYRNGNIWGRVE